MRSYPKILKIIKINTKIIFFLQLLKNLDLPWTSILSRISTPILAFKSHG